MIQRNNILLLGAGSMGEAIAFDLITHHPELSLIVVDRSEQSLKRFQQRFQNLGIKYHNVDIDDTSTLLKLFRRSKVAIGAASYHYNARMTELAISTGAHWVDLGGNNSIVEKQFNQHNTAKETGVIVIPDCGLAPGMVSLIGAHAVRELNETDELHFRVGGLPQYPKPPLNYELCFSPQGLINEYIEPALFIENGEIVEASSLTGWERVHIGAPFGSLEAFHTSGGASTMINTYRDVVKNLDYKTLRYHGHLKQIKLLNDIGFFSSEDLSINDSNSIRPRDMTAKLLEKKLGWVKDDLVILKCWALGYSNGKRQKITYRLLDYYDPETNLSAMARTTGFSAAVIASMILNDYIKDRGVLRQEVSVPSYRYLEELKNRGLKVDIQWESIP